MVIVPQCTYHIDFPNALVHCVYKMGGWGTGFINSYYCFPPPPHIVRLNEFADMTFEEFSRLRLMDPQHCSATTKETGKKSERRTDVPTSIDWRDKGAVTHVKNQVSSVSCATTL